MSPYSDPRYYGLLKRPRNRLFKRRSRAPPSSTMLKPRLQQDEEDQKASEQITEAQRNLLKLRLNDARQRFWEKFDREVPNTIPQLILPNKTLAGIVRYAYRITDVEQLTQELEKQRFCVRVSLLSQSDLNEMVWVINDTLSRGTLSP